MIGKNTVKLVDATINDFARECNRLAAENKDFAMRYLVGQGVRGTVTAETIKQLEKDTFDSNGEITKKAVENALVATKLPKNTTLERLFDIWGRKISGQAMREELGLQGKHL